MNNQDFPDFDFTPEEEIVNKQPSFFDEQVVRRGKRYAARATEAIGGLPGDILGLLKGIATSLPMQSEDPNFIQRAGQALIDKVPGGADLRDLSSKLLPSLEPKNEAERIEDAIVGDLAVLALPVKGKIPFARALGTSLAGNVGKETVAAFGFGDKAQEATKLGMMVFSGMFGKGRGINTYINNLYSKAEGLVPEGASVKFPAKGLETFEKTLQKGGIDATKQPIMDIISDMKAKSINGMIPVDEAVAFDKRINKGRFSGGDKVKKFYFGKLKTINSKPLEEYAAENPTWGSSYKEAKQAAAGIAQSEKVQNYIRSNISMKDMGYAALALGLEDIAAGYLELPAKATSIIAGTAAAGGGVYAAEVARRLAKNPALRKYYINTVNASLKENKMSLAKNLSGLNREMKKSIEEEPLDFFDFSEME